MIFIKYFIQTFQNAKNYKCCHIQLFFESREKKVNKTKANDPLLFAVLFLYNP